jgi:hypothetical protein
MQFIRTFHPVGQGAFYTERHILDGEEFNIVYDCGSTSIRRQKLRKKIETTFRKDQIIDVLFISHFHDDHINGIRYLKDRCNIETVVMPYVNEEAKTLLLIENNISGGYKFALGNLIDEPKKFFGKHTKIVQIWGFSANDAGTPQTIELFGDKELPLAVSSDTRFTIKSTKWFYIPYNFNAGTKQTDFFNELKEQGITIEKGKEKEIVHANWDKIRKAYEKICNSKLNTTSMALFSGKEGKDTIMCTCSDHLPPKEIESGCLYTGDVNLNGNVTNITDKLNGFYDNIGTLQVPHHGSIKDFDCSILKGGTIECAVISYGNRNKYGHPSTRVVEELRVNDVSDHHVTECPSSMVIQVKR